MPALTRTLATASILLGLLGATQPARAQQMTADQQRCISAMNSDLRKVARAVSKDVCACLRSFARDRTADLGPGGTAESCLTADVGFNVGSATLRTTRDFERRCTGVSSRDPSSPRKPPYGVTDADTVNAAGERAIDIAHDIFGPDLDTALHRQSSNSDGALCQRQVARAAKKCLDVRLKEYNRCKQAGLRDGKITGRADLEACIVRMSSRMVKACAIGTGAIQEAIDRRCVKRSVDLEQAFPGCATSDPLALHDCVANSVECHTCEALNVADGLTKLCDGCNACGDGVFQPALGEECDDGNTSDGDGCSATCLLTACGNGLLEQGEECDDGNTVAEDGCSDVCAVEFCGDGVVQSGLGEQCDDGNTSDGDGCSATCLLTACGNGLLEQGEECDDGNTVAEDGCSDVCVAEFCGDGIVQSGLGETCDDGNTIAEDGCSDVCAVEFCGDGILQPGLGEECDDGETVSGDGCSANCILVPTVSLGLHIGPLADDAFCDSGSREGLPCTDTITNTDCLEPGTRCIAFSHAILNTQIKQPTVVIPLIGGFEIDCSGAPPDPVTGEASCTCNLLELAGVPIPAIGNVCFDSFRGCPAGTIDCDGGTPLDMQNVVQHSMSFCGLLDDPNDIKTMPGTGNAECDGSCNDYCASLGPNFVQLESECEGYCISGPRIDQGCRVDVDCPEGACAGGDPVEHKNQCNCSCLEVAGGPSRPGGLACQAGVQITVENFEPCRSLDGLDDITINLPGKCVPLTSENSVGTIFNANNRAFTLAGGERLGDPPRCATLQGDPALPVDARLAGNIPFWDSALGDLQTPVIVQFK